MSDWNASDNHLLLITNYYSLTTLDEITQNRHTHPLALLGVELQAVQPPPPDHRGVTHAVLGLRQRIVRGCVTVVAMVEVGVVARQKAVEEHGLTRRQDLVPAGLWHLQPSCLEAPHTAGQQP